MTILLPEKLRGSFRRALLSPQFLLVFALLLFAGDWLGKNFLFEPPSRWFGDYLLRLRDRVPAARVRLVRIEEEDQRRILGGQSPVNGVALVNAVCALVRSAPAVVVVDIDTGSDQSFPDPFSLPKMGAPVVWAIDADWQRAENGLELKSGRVMAGRLPEAPLYGIARMPLGFDGVVREWERSFMVNGHAEQSLAAAAVASYCKTGVECHEPLETSFGREYVFAKMNLGEFAVAPTADGVPEACRAAAPPERDPRLEGRIVVLGALHSRADKHDTPWGTKYGAELVASAIEEDLNPDGLAHLPVPVKWSMKALIALGIAALHHYLRPVWATGFSVLLLPIAVMLSALAIFYFGDYELAVVPLVVGILLEQLVTSAEKAEHWAKHAELLPK
jgi:CHASE2 domain